MQIAPLSRADVRAYAEIRRDLEQTTGRTNGRFADTDWTPIRYLNRNFPHDVLMGFMRSALIGIVTPVRDGMNLVAKEFVAAQDPADPGVLILSTLAGAARELDQRADGQSVRHARHGACHTAGLQHAAGRAARASPGHARGIAPQFDLRLAFELRAARSSRARSRGSSVASADPVVCRRMTAPRETNKDTNKRDMLAAFALMAAVALAMLHREFAAGLELPRPAAQGRGHRHRAVAADQERYCTGSTTVSWRCSSCWWASRSSASA